MEAGNAGGGIVSQGVEGSFVVALRNGLELSTGFAFVDSTVSEDEPLLFATEGQQLPYEPEWKVTAGANYDFSLTSEIDGNVNFRVRYVGEQRSAFEDRNGFNPSTVNVPIDDYVVGRFQNRIATRRLQRKFLHQQCIR